MRVLSHETTIHCPHGVQVVIPKLGHHLTVGGTPALTAEEIEAGTIACVDQVKCVKLTVVAGRASHLTLTANGGRFTPVLETVEVQTNAGPCQVRPMAGSLSAHP
jgi:hypothetical protein